MEQITYSVPLAIYRLNYLIVPEVKLSGAKRARALSNRIILSGDVTTPTQCRLQTTLLPPDSLHSDRYETNAPKSLHVSSRTAQCTHG